MTLYVDGVKASSTTILPGKGIMATTLPMTIGARLSTGVGSDPSVATNYGFQFVGEVCQVAVYNYALSSNQVLTHYLSSGIAPTVTQQPPAATNVDENGTLTITAGVAGTAPLSVQWIDANTQGPILGQTNLTLVLGNYPLNSNGSAYELTASNIYGAVVSGSVSVTVNHGAPVIVQNLPASGMAEVGPFTLSVTATGTDPLSYTWYENGVSVVTSTNNTFVGNVTTGTNQFYVVVNNAFSPPAVSQTESVIGVAGLPPIMFPVTGNSGWTINSSGTAAPAGSNVLDSGQLTMTFNLGIETRTAWYNTKEDITAFVCMFTYQDLTASPNGADGVTFALQNSATGLTVNGGGGGSLAYTTITPSAAFIMNIYHGAAASGGLLADTMMFGINGTLPTTAPPMAATAPVVLDSGDPIDVTLYYNGTTLYASLFDTVTSNTAALATNINLVSLVGTPAFIGFTAADGGSAATQQISNFSYYTGVTVPLLSAAPTATNVTVSWPQTTSSLFMLQTTTNLLGPWNSVSGVLNGNGTKVQYTTPATGTARFYRLILPVVP
jgi:hypothetical protein